VCSRNISKYSGKVMNQFTTPKTFQAKPSSAKKKIALVVFIAGAISFTLAVAKVIEPGNGMFFFIGGLLAMVFSARFWLMQVKRGPQALTFDSKGITIANKSLDEIIVWGDLLSIKYMAGSSHYWEFRWRGSEERAYYFLDGLSSAQQAELLQTITSIQLPGVLVQPVYDPMGMLAVED
jgi:tRNA(His) 5'-end guanylyltransferase